VEKSPCKEQVTCAAAHQRLVGLTMENVCYNVSCVSIGMQVNLADPVGVAADIYQ